MCLPCCVRVVKQGSLVIIIFIGLKISAENNKKKKKLPEIPRWNTRVDHLVYLLIHVETTEYYFNQ